jgi:uncharacterized repeat protein (TIGR01451 family)
MPFAPRLRVRPVRWLLVWILCAALTALRSAAAARVPPPLGPTHAFTLFKLTGATGTTAAGINDAGQVAGVLYEPTHQHAALWSAEGVPQDLGLLEGSGTRSYAFALNNLGEVAGSSEIAPGQPHAFLWLPAPAHGLPAGMNDLGTLGGAVSAAFDVNDRGEVVGVSTVADGIGRAFLWLPQPAYGLPAGMNDLGLPEGASGAVAYAVNNQGQVAGTCQGAGEPTQAVLWEGGRAQKLGTLGGESASAYGISESGEVVGEAETSDHHTGGRPVRHAFLWTRGGTDGIATNPEMTDLGASKPNSDSRALAINGAGLVVGSLELEVGQGYQGVVWQHGETFDLQANNPDPEHIRLGYASSVNSRGQIVGLGIENRVERGYRLDPVPASDLSLEQSAPTSGKVGRPLTFTLIARNDGPAPATGVTFVDTLPGGAELLSVDTTQGTVTEGDQTVTVDLGALAPGGTSTISVTLKPLQAGALTNTAEVSSPAPDPTPSDNLSSLEVRVEPLRADLSLRFQLIGNSARVGRPVSYAAVVTNRGPDPATGVRLTDVLPQGVEFVSANASQGAVGEEDGTVTAELGTLASGAQASVTLTVTPTATGPLANTAAVTSQEEDPTPDDAAVTVTVTVMPPPAPDLTGIWESLRLKSVSHGRGRHRKVTLHLRGKLTVRNVGEAPSGRTRARFFLSRDQTLDPADPPFAVPLAAVRALTPGASVAVPRPEPPGAAAGFDVKVARGKHGGSALRGRFLIARIVPVDGETSRENNTVVSSPLP